MKKRRSAEQIVGLLRQADVDLGKGMNVPDVCRRLGISQQTYYRWRTKYGGIALAGSIENTLKRTGMPSRSASSARQMSMLEPTAPRPKNTIVSGGLDCLPAILAIR